jgi:hypothetical protein
MLWLVVMLCTMTTSQCETRAERYLPEPDAMAVCHAEGRAIYAEIEPDDARRVVCRFVNHPAA